jgi:hypothetical protein
MKLSFIASQKVLKKLKTSLSDAVVEERKDSIELSKKIYSGQTVDEIFQRAGKSWKNRKH